MKHLPAPSYEKDLRRLLESNKNIAITHLELNTSKDTLRSMASGLTPVLARIIAKQKNAIGIDLSYLSDKGKKEKAITLARIKQNIVLARKAHAPLALSSAHLEEAYVLLSLGASTNQVKEARTQSF